MSQILYDKLPAFCPSCGNRITKTGIYFCSECGRQLMRLPSEQRGSPASPPVAVPCLYKVPHYEELEEEAKAKIGTFERIYEQTYSRETGLPLVSRLGGFDEWDYAPLVNPLASALEIELNLSLFRLMKQEYGEVTLKWNEKEISLKSSRPTMGDFIGCFDYDRKRKGVLERYGLSSKQDDRLPGLLVAINRVRNRASHKEKVEQKDFMVYYRNIYTVFTEYLERLLHLKCSLQKGGQSVMSQSQTSETVSVTSSKVGILFTNTRTLGRKMCGEYNDGASLALCTEETCQNSVLEALNNYCNSLRRSCGIRYYLLDMAGKMTPETHTWEEFRVALLEAGAAWGIDTDSAPVALFIVGGDDVIPMPRVRNCAVIGEEETEQSIEESTLESDMLYAYGDEHTCPVDDIGFIVVDCLKRKPRFHTGRLPLEEGELSDNACTSFYSYFERVLAEFTPWAQKKQGIEVGEDGHVAVVAESMLQVSGRMLENVPLRSLGHDNSIVCDNKFVSPGLDIDNASLLSTMPEAEIRTYGDTVKQADMLTFVLHGSSHPKGCVYYGQNREMTSMVTAFHPELFKHSKVKVATGVCCWGARYIGFKSEESALLTAFRNGVLLFAGACRSAYGAVDLGLERNANADICCSNWLIKFYLENLMQGYAAGEALEKAKNRYLSVSRDGRYTLTTILEFNLYGDPLLHLTPRLPQSDEDESVLQVARSEKLEEWKQEDESYRLEWVNSEEEVSRSLLQRVRSLVDRNLNDIRTRINRELYSYYHIEPRSLQSIYTLRNKENAERYHFHYLQKEGWYVREVIVRADKKGTIEHIMMSL